MSKVKVGKLNRGDLFKYKGAIYEVMYMTGWSVCCRYVNDPERYALVAKDTVKYADALIDELRK